MNPFVNDSFTNSWQLSYIDFANAFIACIAALFLLAIVDANPAKKDANSEHNAQLIVKMNWEDDNCDVDLWVKDPTNAVTMFKSKVNGLAHLEFDDRGDLNSKTKLADGSMVVSHDHSEYWDMRGIVPGTYKVSVHLFACRLDGTPLKHGEARSLDAKVSVDRVNPDYAVIDSRQVTFHKVWEEIPVVMFDVDALGNILNVESSSEELVSARVDMLSTEVPSVGGGVPGMTTPPH